MIFIPYSAELKLNRIPYVTYVVMLLCILVYYLQVTNNAEIYQSTSGYCQSIYKPDKRVANDYLTQNKRFCVQILSGLQIYYRDGDDDFKAYLHDGIRFEKNENPEKELASIRRHYDALQVYAPSSLDQALMHYPDSLNPVKMITSSLAHGSFMHIFFNLLFFLAFAPALEVLIDNRWKFIKVLLVISFVTGIAYSMMSIGSKPIPTLGLSGVVTGMIGLSAYLMPKARIRVLFWLIVIVKRLYIPAWILAVWYIGWDMYELFKSGNSGGVNLMSHVSGGITGYVLGMLWFKERREEYQDELNDEINIQRRSRSVLTANPDYISDGKKIAQRMEQKASNRDYEEFMNRLYLYVSTDRHSEVVVLMLNDYERQQGSVSIYEEMFGRMSQWCHGRSLLCLGRLIIDMYMQAHQTGKALQYVERCQSISKDFIVAKNDQLILLTQAAIELERYSMAYHLVRNAKQRYAGKLDIVHCRLLEIELLWRHLDEHEQAKSMIKNLLISKPSTHQEEIFELATSISSTRL